MFSIISTSPKTIPPKEICRTILWLLITALQPFSIWILSNLKLPSMRLTTIQFINISHYLSETTWKVFSRTLWFSGLGMNIVNQFTLPFRNNKQTQCGASAANAVRAQAWFGDETMDKGDEFPRPIPLVLWSRAKAVTIRWISPPCPADIPFFPKYGK